MKQARHEPLLITCITLTARGQRKSRRLGPRYLRALDSPSTVPPEHCPTSGAKFCIIHVCPRSSLTCKCFPAQGAAYVQGRYSHRNWSSSGQNSRSGQQATSMTSTTMGERNLKTCCTCQRIASSRPQSMKSKTQTGFHSPSTVDR